MELDNPQLLLLEIEEFNRNSSDQDEHIPQNLENFIEYVSKTGTYVFPWLQIKKLFLKKLNNIINNLSSYLSATPAACGGDSLNTSASNSFILNYSDPNNAQIIKDRIVERMKSFTSAPFTIQRISELLLKPNNHYNRVDKYLRGLEKCIMVVTTVDPTGNKIFMESLSVNESFSRSATPTKPPISPANEPMNESLILTTPMKPIESVSLEVTESIELKEDSSITETTSVDITIKTTLIEEQIETIEESTTPIEAVSS